MKKIDFTLLKDLCEIIHPSNEEYPMISYVLNYCYRIEGITFELDEANNLFITKDTTNPETFPCLVAHLDEILTHKEPKHVSIKKDIISGKYSDGTQCGLGLDDTFGIYICLHCLKLFPDLKICLTTAEEMGCVGAETAAFNIEFFNNCRYMLQADRMGKNDLITKTNGLVVTSDEFLKDIDHLMEKYGYSVATGTMTDIGTLKENINLVAVNISCGYYNAHTHQEYGKLSELQNCLNFIIDIINNNTKVYEHTSEIPNYSYKYFDDDATYWEEKYKDYYYDSYEPNWDKVNKICSNCKFYDCANCKHINEIYG